MMRIESGSPFPIGATANEFGVNFSVFSKSSVGMEILLFDQADDTRPVFAISLSPDTNRTHYYWHAFIPGLQPGQIYAFRALGDYRPEAGLLFDPDKVLLDPYGRCVVVPDTYSRRQATLPGNNCSTAMKSVVTGMHRYDWGGDTTLRTSFESTVIYEMHVAGFTRHPSSGVSPEKRGTYAGVIEKIPYLVDLGVTAVELLPVFHFDEQDCPPGKVNYWGYAPISFFAPHPGYSACKEPLGVLNEFRDMVKALHKAGIEVILDVVYNHTAEGPATGPTLSFRGLANDSYYLLEKGDAARYADFAGTGNTLNSNGPIVRRMIVQSLRYWVQEMHIDGFRFDLASILSRDENGHPQARPPILFDIETDPTLANTKIIAEAWDAAGLYQVGSFIGDRWKEWNGRFRDDVRAFFRGDRGSVEKMPHRLTASPDIYGHREREPEQSVNFITCHDGFTLNDLVSYNRKHNEANGENNRDGENHNLSWNCGVEGPTDSPAIESLRKRQIKNMLATTLLSLGTPMVLMGDEMRRTQYGNNNGYCQDNELSWLDWSLLEKNAEIHRFMRSLIRHRATRRRKGAHSRLSLGEFLHHSKVQMHGVKLYEPDWSDYSHTLAMTIWNMVGGVWAFHVILNAYNKSLEFELPPLPKPRRWLRWIDTSLPSPDDIMDDGMSPPVDGESYQAGAHSVVVLVSAVELAME